jgi:hypothetical protein
MGSTAIAGEAAGRDSAGSAPVAAGQWPLWQRILFRFFFVYLLLQITPWDWFSVIPGLPYILRYYRLLTIWAVTAGNAHFFHVREKLILPNGSGDTSFAWAELWLYLCIALVACIVWSVLDRRRREYDRLLYWLRLCVRYYVAAAALSYGIIKLYALQMPFPTTSQLATPLGDLLPMRFSWLFIGYSLPYQIFSGAMETMAGLLLLYRRTVTAGLFAATGAFANVVMINVSYDVPVKLYSMHLLFSCLFLLALDSKRLVNLLVLNRATPPTTPLAVEAAWTEVWGGRAVKLFFVYELLLLPVIHGRGSYRQANAPRKAGPFAPGLYEVRSYIVNRGGGPAAVADTIRWKDLIIDSNTAGSVNSTDPLFRQLYRRGYFRYKPDTVTHVATVWRTSFVKGDSTFLFTMRYEVPDSNTIRLHTVIRGDSVHVEAVRVPRHFQLTERQFHWLSEYNR